MANIVEATIRLLQTTTPQDITLRDVARESGHGHRLIVEWFGGKGGLYSAVFDEIFRRLRETGDLFYADVPTRRDVKMAFQVANYMLMHHPEYVQGVRDMAVMDALRDRMQTALRLSPEQSLTAARRLSILTLGISLFQEFIQLSDEDAVRMMQNEFKDTTGVDLPAHPPAQ